MSIILRKYIYILKHTFWLYYVKDSIIKFNPLYSF